MSNTTQWLVKDDHHVSGPFTESEIQTELTQGRLSPAAMACLPQQGCWIFLINYPQFAGWADKISSEDITKSLSGFNTTNKVLFDTVTGTFSIQSRPSLPTGTGTPTGTPTEMPNNANTFNTMESKKTSKPTTPSQTQELKQKSTAPPPSSPKAHAANQQPDYTLQPPRKQHKILREQKKKLERVLLYLLLSIAAFLGLYLIFLSK